MQLVRGNAVVPRRDMLGKGGGGGCAVLCGQGCASVPAVLGSSGTGIASAVSPLLWQ